MRFEQGSQVAYVELEENDVSRRYILPNYADLETKVKVVLLNAPKVILVNSGTATVTSEPSDDVDNVTGVQAIPSSVNAVYNVQLHSHPVLGGQTTTARFSEDLAGLIGSAEVVKQEVVASVPTAPAEPKVDLTSQLRQQMLGGAQQKLEKPQVEVEVVKQEDENAPPPGQMKLEDFIAQEKAKKVAEPTKAQINESLRPKPVGKIDVLIDEVQSLQEEVNDLRSLIVELKIGLGI